MNPFALPAGPVQIAFSGGRTSAFMLHCILEANGGLPDGVVLTFQNTGREMPQTLDFVQEVSDRWVVPITWLEYRETAPGYEVVNHNSASRSGEPFEALIRKRRMLPNQQMRFCTSELKIRPAKKWLIAQGWRRWTNAIGIRADEAHRMAGPEPVARQTRWAPLIEAGIGRQDVAAFWAAQPFDLRLPNVRGNCWLGNCDGCFLKSEAHVAAFTREFPDRAEWWERMETLIPSKAGSAGTFSKRYTRREMREMMDRQGDFLLSTDGALCQASDGECMA